MSIHLNISVENTDLESKNFLKKNGIIYSSQICKDGLMIYLIHVIIPIHYHE